ncbi:hypothetical protein [Levilactobacillus zymae]|uniref:Uncharacterized protein n=1 Tax=Levilactobacillus zymae TaxID=267363 RepID=A0A1Y6JY88_9LACO|nr:hypothetical protein [Levilactobacillus zymae]SMS14815.1 hypothetical protein LZ3411_1765 [Levilactobacillus zymae]
METESLTKPRPTTTNFPRTTTLRNKLGYALGDVGNNFLFDMGQLYLTRSASSVTMTY